MSRHSFALLLSMIHKNILMSAYLMHIDVSINWRKTIHKSNFFSLKSQKKCTNNRIFPTGREWGGAPPTSQNSLIPPPSHLENPPPSRLPPTKFLFPPHQKSITPLELGSTTLADLYLLIRKPWFFLIFCCISLHSEFLPV